MEVWNVNISVQRKDYFIKYILKAPLIDTLQLKIEIEIKMEGLIGKYSTS